MQRISGESLNWFQRKLFLIILLCFSAFAVTAQEYNIKQYRVGDGLPSDILKGCAQDSLGYFWIATDEGIVRYDGIKFINYRSLMHSNYAKGFLKTRNGKLLAYSDLDLIEIQNNGDTVVFKKICAVDRIPNDTTISYPKLLFEDSGGNIWVSESQSVVRLGAKNLSRYDFDLSNRTPQFLRAFSFFEDRKHNLYVTSFQGNVFRYDKTSDTFKSTNIKFPSSVESVVNINGQIFIGSAEGISEARLPEEGGIETPRLLIKLPMVSCINPLSKNRFIVGTRGNRHYFVDIKNATSYAIPTIISSVNNIYVSTENDIWLSGNDGLILMREELFLNANPEVSEFIETVDEDVTTGMIYYATATKLYSYNPNTKKNKLEMEMPDGYFQSILTTPKGVWVANAFKVFFYANGKITTQFDFSHNRRFVTGLTRGHGENIWLSIPGTQNVYRIKSDLKLEDFKVPFEKEGVVNVVRKGAEGMYIASTGKNSYLFFKRWADSIFQNISIPISFALHGDFNVTDIVVDKDVIWMATSEGLLKYDSKSVERVNLGEKFTDRPVESMVPYPGGKLLFSNAFGILLYDIKKKSYDLYTESSGLLSNTITTRGLFISKNERTWLGTAKGLCYSTRLLTSLGTTPAPKFIEVDVNGKKHTLNTDNRFDYGSFVSVTISSITFPENEISFQYKFSTQENWKTTPEHILLSSLTPGKYTLQVRSKKNGPFAMSSVEELTFEIEKPFWQQGWFYLFLILSTLGLISITTIGVNALNVKRQRKLQLLIDERTNELRQANEKLIDLNEEKNSLISIVAHDLKSPLSQISGLISIVKMSKNLDAETDQYITLMDGSTKRLSSMIEKILDVEAIEAQKLNLKLEDLNLSATLNHVTERFLNQASKKRISILREIDADAFVLADRIYIEQVLENLISNAIKFSEHDRKVYVMLRANVIDVVCEVKDEGPGLSEDDKKKLFGKFQKLSAQPTGDEGSTGLGLSIVKKFVVAMKGEIWCESEPGKGASFFVSLKRLTTLRIRK